MRLTVCKSRRCPGCGESNDSIDPSYGMQLGLELLNSHKIGTRSVSVQKCVDEYLGTEKVEFKCQNCSFQGSLDRQQHVLSTPEILHIGIKLHSGDNVSIAAEGRIRSHILTFKILEKSS